MAFSSRIVTLDAQPGRDDPLAEHVLGVQQIIVDLLAGQAEGACRLGQEGRAGSQ